MKVLRSSRETGAINSKEHQLECNILWTEGFQTNENNKKAADYICCKTNDFKYWKKETPFTWGRFWLLPSNILARCLALALE
jgi:hypothetical protein